MKAYTGDGSPWTYTGADKTRESGGLVVVYDAEKDSDSMRKWMGYTLRTY
jgi:hypothetical protein